MEPTFELVTVPVSERYDADDDRWRQQVGDFLADLRHEAVEVERRHRPVPGTRGALSEIVVTLASAGTFTAAFEFFRSWLKRGKGRSLEISFTEGGETRTISLKGDALDDSAMETVARAAMQRIGGPGWQTPATEPS